MPSLLLIGSYDWALTVIPEAYRSEGVDVLHAVGSRMGIDEVRALIKEANLTPLAAEERVFIIAYSDMTTEAQNALLKTLEEPSRTSRFYIVIEREEKLLPTLRSRLVLLEEEIQTDSARKEFETFLAASYGERLKAIGERATKKDDVWMRMLFTDIERYAHDTQSRELMDAVVTFGQYFDRPGSSRKMILEHCALIL